MTSRPRALGGFIPPMPVPAVGSSVRVLTTSPFTTEWYQANPPMVNSVNGKTGAVTLVHSDISDWTSTLAPYAIINSPAFTGVPLAPTPTTGDNSTKLATTAFVQATLTASVSGVASFNTRTGAVTLTFGDVTAVLPPATALPLVDGVAAVGVSAKWAREDHVHPTDYVDCGTY